jgi:hypothetical protein
VAGETFASYYVAQRDTFIRLSIVMSELFEIVTPMAAPSREVERRAQGERARTSFARRLRCESVA